MRAAGLVLAMAVALAVQTTIGRYIGATGIDLVLIVVVCAGLSFGPVPGLLGGTAAGLVQDAMSTGIIGVGGLAKTVVGFLVGSVATQFIVAHPLPRFVVFVAASLVHAAVFMGVYALLGVRDFGDPYMRVGLPALTNAIVGLLACRMIDALPGGDERHGRAGGRMRR